MSFLEIACFNPESVAIAAAAGAHRAELCREKITEGLTPTFQDIELALSFNIPLNIMVRPRAGNYVYDEEEFAVLLKEVEALGQLPLNGLVFGTLLADGTIPYEQNIRLVEAAGNIPCTYHRAFDEVNDPEQSLETLVRCGFKIVLTSGGARRAIDAAQLLKQLVQQSNGRITVMPGGGVRSAHAHELLVTTGAKWLHSSAITNGGELADPTEIKALLKAIQ